MERSVESLWKARVGAFWRESMPYISDMLRSGVPFVFAMAALTALASYTSLLRDMPADFPFTIVGIAALTPFISYNPLRTWLREADLVFLMPLEGQMDRYISKSLRYNGLAGLAAVLFVCLIYIPIYVKGPGQLHAALLVGVVIALKLLGAYAAWQERRMVWNGSRRGIRVLRWLVTAVCVGALVQSEPWIGLTITLLSIVLFGLLYRSMSKFRLPWQTLIREERKTKRRYVVFFSAFADVPSETANIARRGYLAWMAKSIAYKQSNAFVYLYAHSLYRTELGGITLRLTLLGMFCGALAAESGLALGWGAAAVYVLFVWLVGVQLAALTQAHRHSVWRHVYPLPDRLRFEAVQRVDRSAYVLCAILLLVPHAILLPGQGYIAQLVVNALAAVVLILLVRPGRLRRKMQLDLEED